MIRIFLSVLFLSVFFSCKESKELPSGVLPPQKMQAALMDMMLADELGRYYFVVDSAEHFTPRQSDYYSKVLQINKIDKKTFIKSLQYYQTRPDLLRPILENLEAEVQVKVDGPKKTGKQ